MASTRPHRPSPFQVGEVIAGKYRIERVLGEGGMGVVYAAHHEMLAQQVALKVLRAEALTNADMVTRFINEGRAAARIRSEHVARLMDVGVLEATGAPYMVMELLQGEDLARRLKAGRLPIVHAVDLVLQALEAVAEAHALGIVHRDLKPANLFLARTPDGGEVLKVLDFGISKAEGALALPSSGAGTSTKAILGTPGYMSPEQLRSSRAVDARADIWSVGVVLFEALTGELPFKGETVGDLFGAILEDKPPRLCSLREDAPGPLDEAVARCIQRKPDARFANVVDLAAAIAPFGSPATSFASVERIGRALARSSGSLPGSARSSGSGAASGPASSVPIPVVEEPIESAPTAMAPPATAASWAASSRVQPKGAPHTVVVGAVALIAVALIAAATILFIRGRTVVTYVVMVDAASSGTTTLASAPPAETGIPLPPPTAADERRAAAPPSVPIVKKKPPTTAVVPPTPPASSAAKPPAVTTPPPPLDGNSILRDRR